MIIAPLMAGYLSFCILINSYPFFFVSTICYFFVLDSIGVPGPGIIADISKFYFIPKSIFKVYVNYIFYRLLSGFVFNFVPALLIFLFVNEALPQEERHLAVGYCVLIFSCSWVFYVLASVPMLVMAFRRNAFYQLMSMFAFPFYSIIMIVLLEVYWKAFVMRDYLAFVWVLIGLVFISMGISFIKFLKNEVLYPEKKNSKLGFYK